jgi:hypothetical protein
MVRSQINPDLPNSRILKKERFSGDATGSHNFASGERVK